ncbi:flagellar biosynthesis protein FlhB [Endozoicomonas sp. OPT23]|uniref:flagellar biosynthesis protein FlhB n=1 Tax=Endozoicomonas sp. OPT23 TaxID=2072845 RepID=UPI00129A8D96|nr:flagellar biosynthesis protein FlhB [Endozoicomonas sp. OPT23]MRI33952.1 flagellar biosynthesis protein FlhB [Endozoicomonas sp. OPT23]
MSETDQEKTEEPSARRLEKSREDGQIARSRELNSALLLLTACFALKLGLIAAADAMKGVMENSFSLTRSQIMDTGTMFMAVENSLSAILPITSAIIFSLFMAGVLGQLMVGGWLFSSKNLAPKFERMNPLKWPGKVFSKNGAMELLKSVLKIVLIFSCLCWLTLKYYPILINLSRQPLMPAIATGLSIMGTSFLTYALVMVLIAAIDAPFQIWSHKEKLKMTRQEVKDENKDMEGNPEVKQKIRQIQREMANQRMIQQVPDADVIITNPTHYSVALKYDTERSSAPFVIAKGVDQIALHIRDIANGNNIQIIEAPLLTRAVYHTTKLDQEIPADLYLAVAQVLAYVHQLNQFRKGSDTSKPNLPELDIPEAYKKY